MTAFNSDASRWTAVQARDLTADGVFVYCVRTTRIYCRPTCKARLARRANVTFHKSPRDAQRAGFRACRRCQPDEAGTLPDEKAVQKIKSFVAEVEMAQSEHHFAADNAAHEASSDLSEELNQDKHTPRSDSSNAHSLQDMAAKTGMSKWHFHRVFKRVMGMTPREWAKSVDIVKTGDISEVPLVSGDMFSDLDWNLLLDGAGLDVDGTDWLDGDAMSQLQRELSDPEPSLGSTIPSQPDFLRSYTPKPVVSYAIRPVANGLLLVVFCVGQIRTIHQAHTESELMAVLHETFPLSTYTHRSLLNEAVYGLQADGMHSIQAPVGAADQKMVGRLDALVELIEKPV